MVRLIFLSIILLVVLSSFILGYELNINFESIKNLNVSNNTEVLIVNYTDSLNLNLGSNSFFNFGVVDSDLILDLSIDNISNSNSSLNNSSKYSVLNVGIETFVVETNKYSDYIFRFIKLD